MEINNFLNIISEPFVLRAMIGGILVAVICAILGVFITLKKESFISDATAHASLAGVGISFMLGLTPIVPAMVVAVIMGLLIVFFKNRTKVSSDSITGIFFTFLFSVGVILLHLNPVGRRELDSYLFGSILSIGIESIILTLILFVIIIIFLQIFSKKILFITFDPEGAETRGIKKDVYEYVIAALTAAAIVISSKAVGVILVTALLVVPSVSAKLLAKNFSQMFTYSLIHNIISFVVGIFLAVYLPAGPVIVITSVVLFLLVFIYSKIFKKD